MNASPCRISTNKRRHHCSPQHAELVLSYRDARRADELRADVESYGYATELAEYRRDHPAVTFKAWLKAHKRTDDTATDTRVPVTDAELDAAGF